MKEYLDQGIKEIIDRFPKVADILGSYQIGCVPCQVGTCKLRDVIEIHNLSAQQEEELFKRIAEVIFPGQPVEIPQLERQPVSAEKKLSPPMNKLIEEHKYIKRLIALAPQLTELAKKDWRQAESLLPDVIEFIRNYADRFHHAKEEDILFKYFDENLEILKVMRQDHETARSYVRGLAMGLAAGDRAETLKNLTGYAELLKEHIKREDEILYPWLDKNLTMAQVGELFSRFNQVEENLKQERRKNEELVSRLEQMVKGG